MAPAFPRRRVAAIERLTGGLSNSSYKLSLEPGGTTVVLRVYDRDPAACRKEVALLGLVRRTVPVPEVLHAEPEGAEGVASYMISRYVVGITFRRLKATGDLDALAQAAHSAGAALAAVRQSAHPAPSWLPVGPRVDAQAFDGDDPIPRLVERSLASPHLRERAGDGVPDRLHALVWSWAPALRSVAAERALAHGDFRKANVLVGQVHGRWAVTAVLDWEMAFAGSPAFDIATFLRYERARGPAAEPHFSRGYVEAGGVLPDEWRRLCRVADLAALCAALAEPALPPDVADEIADLVRATLEDRDPR